MIETQKSLTDLIVTETPHIKDNQSIKKIMRFVILALIPSNMYAVYLFGIDALIILCVSVLSAAAAEALFQLFLKKPLSLFDGSAVITGLLVAMNVPAGLPVWIVIVGSFFSIIIIKQLFGGLGFNIFNPALAGLAFINAFWPVEMTTKVGNITQTIANEWPLYNISFGPFFTGNINGYPGEASIFLLLAGTVFLLINKIINWHIPAAFIGTTAIFMLLYYAVTEFAYPVAGTLMQLFSGGFLICALFMATDTVTSPITRKGMIIFGIGCGLLTSIIRLWSDSGAVCFAVLIMNATVPMIDRYTRPRVFGR
ncbi:MAG: RnfABCDGE type electron transport complex subunit D [Spirochaetes bacterium]|nr:RnfABCDGE type electron transport complex subunit D [Spirochaetota bacterium]